MHRFTPTLLTRSILRSLKSVHQNDVSPASPRTPRGAFLTALLITFAATQAAAQLTAEVSSHAAGVIVAAPASAAGGAASSGSAPTIAVTPSATAIANPAPVAATRAQSSTTADAMVTAPALSGSVIAPTTPPAAVAPPTAMPASVPVVASTPTLASLPATAARDVPLVGVVSEISAELPPADIWDRIRAGYAMEDLDDPLVAKWEKYYADRPEYMARIVERSSKYMFYIVTELERRGMPLEIALLPMIESAFNPVANSSAKASGIWQFIPSTGELRHEAGLVV